MARGDATENGNDVEISSSTRQRCNDILKDIAYLNAQLSSGHKNQRRHPTIQRFVLHRSVALLSQQLLNEGQGKGAGFPATGRGFAPDTVMLILFHLNDLGNNELLNRRRCLPILPSYRFQHVLRKVQRGKGGR